MPPRSNRPGGNHAGSNHFLRQAHVARARLSGARWAEGGGVSDAALILVVNALLGVLGFLGFRASNAVGAIKRLFLADVPSRSDIDRIFGSTRANWNQRARAAQYVIGWSTRIQPRAEGDCVRAFDRKTGRGVSLQPFYFQADSPPETVSFHHYFPVGQLTLDERFKSRIESRARAGLGSSYGVTVRISRTPDGKFDVFTVSIAKAGPARAEEKSCAEAALADRSDGAAE